MKRFLNEFFSEEAVEFSPLQASAATSVKFFASDLSRT